MDWSQLWEWLSDPGTQHTIGWLGGGLVVVIGAAWAAYLHLSRRSASSEKANPERPATIQDVRVTASDGSVAAVAGGHLTINQRDPLVERAFGVLEQQLSAMRQQLATSQTREQTYQDTIREQRESLRQAVEAIPRQTDVSDAQEKIRRALELAGDGETSAAEALFEEVEQRKTAEGRTANKEAAEAARHLGALAFLGDTARAIAAYERAAELDPEHLETWFQLGQARIYAGNLSTAATAYAQALRLSKAGGDEREVARASAHLGDVRRAQGDLAGALTAYQQSLDIRERLAAADPSNTEWQRDLSISHNRIGEVRSAQGDLAGALTAYQQSHAIAERLAAADPSNGEWQSDVAVSCWNLASVLGQSDDPREQARAYLERGHSLLVALRDSARLAPFRLSWIGAFEQALEGLDRPAKP